LTFEIAHKHTAAGTQNRPTAAVSVNGGEYGPDSFQQIIIVNDYPTVSNEAEGIRTPKGAGLVIREDRGVALEGRFEKDAVEDVFGDVGEHVAGEAYGALGNNQPVRSTWDGVRVAFGEAGFEPSGKELI